MDPQITLAQRQLAAIEAFHRARRAAAEATALAERSREMRMDAARRLEVQRREHEALIARAHEQLRLSGEVLLRPSVVRAVVAHRQPWFTDKVVGCLQQAGVEVVARTDNGADAVGIVVVEQPDLLLVEETLLMVPGEEVVRETRRYCADAVISAQVPSGDRVGRMLDAGASTVSTRQVPPAEVVEQALALLERS